MRAEVEADSAERPASSGCSTTSWVAKHHGCCPPRCSRCGDGVGRALPGAANRSYEGGSPAVGRVAGRDRAVFSFGQGVIHTYYTVALAPAVAALVAIGRVVQLWQYRQHIQARVIGALGIVGTAAWSYELLSRSPSYVPWLRIVVLAAGAMSAVALVLAPLATRLDRHLTRAWVGLGLIAGLTGPAAFVGTTVTTAYTGSVPSAGPAVTSAVTGGGAPGGGDGGGGGASSGSAPSGASTGSASSGTSLGTRLSGTSGTRPSEHSGTRPTANSGTTTPAAGAESRTPAAGGAADGGDPGGGGGGLSTSSALVRTLEKDAGSYRWVAATFGSQGAANLELATNGDSVMAIGGFNNNGGNLTLAQFKAYVAAGDIHYFLASGGGGAGGGTSGSEAAISKWVAEHYTSTTIGGQTVYDALPTADMEAAPQSELRQACPPRGGAS